MPSATPIAPATDGSAPPAVVSAALAALERERAARRAAEALAPRLEAENAEIAEQVRRLEHLNDELRKALFGKKSEKLGEDERQLSFDDLGTAVAEAGGAPEAGEQGEEAEARRQRRPTRPPARFPARLERRVEVIEPASTLCPCGCGEMTKIGAAAAISWKHTAAGGATAMGRQRAATPLRPLLGTFTDHPASVGETYRDYMVVALGYGARLVRAGCAAMVHAFLPALFETTASETIRAMHAEMENRGSPPPASWSGGDPASVVSTRAS